MKNLIRLLSLTALLIASQLVKATTVEFIQAKAIEVQKELPKEIAQSLAQKDLILVGEMHGTNEQPARTFQMVKQLAETAPYIVGLEFPLNIQPQLDQFFATGDENILRGIYFFKEPRYHSGRGSQAMIKLMHDLRSLKNVKVVAFDVPDDYRGNERDTQMAKNILKILKDNPNQKMLVYTGNVHSALVTGFGWDQTAITMGAEILRLGEGAYTFNNVTNVRYRYLQGKAWYCYYQSNGTVGCSARAFQPTPSLYSEANDLKEYFLIEPELTLGHDHTFFIRDLTASNPF